MEPAVPLQTGRDLAADLRIGGLRALAQFEALAAYYTLTRWAFERY